MKNFFYPTKDVPEEEEWQKRALAFRKSKVKEIRAQLKTDPCLNARINNITEMLSGASAAEPEPE